MYCCAYAGRSWEAEENSVVSVRLAGGTMSTQAGRLSVTELARCEHCAVLRVSGELDQNCEQFFLRAIGTRVLSGHRHLVLDVTALTFCDSRGLNCLLAARWLLQRREGMLLLAG